MSKPRTDAESSSISTSPLAGRHLSFGWWTLLVFLTLGIVLEALHAFKVGSYLSVANETRRLMWTLAHAHGALLGLVHLAFAFAVRTIPDWPMKSRSIASSTLIGATILMPAGFFLGGVGSKAGDPGLGIVLLPVGAALLVLSVLLTALATKRL